MSAAGASSRSPFDFNTDILLDDLEKAGMDLCADAHDALDKKIIHANGLPDAAKVELQKVTNQLFDTALDNLDQLFEKFHRLAAATFLHIPKELYMQQPSTLSVEPVDPDAEAALDVELESMRQNIAQSRQECRTLSKQIRAWDRHLQQSGTASDFKPLLDALSSSKTSLVEDFNAIGTAVHTLQPLLARMQQLQANKAAAHAGATAALSAGGDIAAVERRVRQQMAETAGCMHTLQELRQVLMPVDDQPAV
eukprot:jgi/Chrzof1/2562/Cz11g20130.t1